MRRRTCLFIAMLTACAAPEPAPKTPTPAAPVIAAPPIPAPIKIEPIKPPKPLGFVAANLDTWKSASCPKDAANLAPASLVITAKSLPARAIADIKAALPPAANLHAAYVLTANNANFGGLSGLEFTSGQLLSVSDAGAFVWIDLKDGAPSGTGALAYMRDANGNMLSGKADGDAEGLVYTEGVALVSFERRHRIEAFDLAGCGDSARAVSVATLSMQVDGVSLSENEGPEALWLDSVGVLRFGIEMQGASGAPTGYINDSGTAEIDAAQMPAGFLLRLVGADAYTRADGSSANAHLFRGFTPLTGALIELRWGPRENERLKMQRPLTVDNFEGLAAEPISPGKVRFWLIADNNFAPVQQTLLYAIDVTL